MLMMMTGVLEAGKPYLLQEALEEFLCEAFP